jgi:hypothetical protein
MGRINTAPRLAVAGAGALIAGYLAWRPRMLRWGATDEEASETLPGDEHTPKPRTQSTRAITIDAPPEQVWPWLVQMGIHRAGFYTHDWLERLLFRARYVEGRHSATRIHPELQDLKPGDRIYMGGGAYVPVTEVEPNRHLVAFETFVLRPLPGARTRLIARTRGMGYLLPALSVVARDASPLPRLIAFVVRHLPGADLLARGFDFFISDPLHHYMDTGVLKGVKKRAEGAFSHGDDDSGAIRPAAAAVEPVAAGRLPER